MDQLYDEMFYGNVILSLKIHSCTLSKDMVNVSFTMLLQIFFSLFLDVDWIYGMSVVVPFLIFSLFYVVALVWILITDWIG